MKNTKIVQLGLVRDLLAELDKVRQAIIGGRVSSFSVVLRCEGGTETVYLGGAYKESPGEALRATLKMSAARTLLEDPPPTKPRRKRRA